MTSSYNNISLKLKLLRLKCRIGKKLNRFTKTEKNVYVWSRIPLYKEIWENAAMELSAKFRELSEGILEICYGNRLTRIYNHMVQLDDPVILSLAANKPFCYSLMKKNSLSVPKYLTLRINELDQAKRFMEENKGFFVIKPAVGTSAGMGITTHIKTFRECRKAVALASLYSNEIIIECLIPGESYRLLILDGKMIHASRRSGLRVKGNGQSTIWQLVKREHEYRQERNVNDLLQPVEDDRDFIATLDSQGLSSESIPKAGQEMLVKSFDCFLQKNTEVRTVYDENVTNLICQDIRNQAILAARILNSQFAGVDIITLDPTVSLEKSGGVINEINTTPGLQHHYNLLNNDGNPAVHVLKHLLKISLE